MPEIVSEIVEVFIFKKVKKEIRYLLLKRDEKEVHPDIWSIAGGEIKKGEKTYQAAAREMKEETGLIAKHLYFVDTVNVFYEMKNDVIHITPVFLAEVKDSEVRLSAEHSDYKWMSYEKAFENIFWIGWKNNLKLINKILQDKSLFETLQEIK